MNSKREGTCCRLVKRTSKPIEWYNPKFDEGSNKNKPNVSNGAQEFIHQDNINKEISKKEIELEGYEEDFKKNLSKFNKEQDDMVDYCNEKNKYYYMTNDELVQDTKAKAKEISREKDTVKYLINRLNNEGSKKYQKKQQKRFNKKQRPNFNKQPKDALFSSCLQNAASLPFE